MNTIALTAATARPVANRAADYEIGQVARTLVGLAACCMTFMIVLSLGRAGLGMVEGLHHYNKLPVIIHVAAVLPAVPLGGYILLTRKGTPRHRLLGKIWLVLMLVTATSAIFIKTGGSFSWIHLFVPLTFHAAWKTVATVRRGDIAAHKRHLVLTYMTALMIPGIAAFLAPGRLMNVMLLG
jgi:uncharacterized membrane protein